MEKPGRFYQQNRTEIFFFCFSFLIGPTLEKCAKKMEAESQVPEIVPFPCSSMLIVQTARTYYGWRREL